MASKDPDNLTGGRAAVAGVIIFVAGLVAGILGLVGAVSPVRAFGGLVLFGIIGLALIIYGLIDVMRKRRTRR